MREKPVIFQYVKELLAVPVALLSALSLFAWPEAPQMQKPSLPDPIKFINKRDLVMRASRAVLEDLGYRIELEDPKGGRLVTRPYEFVSGALTSSEIEKIASKTDSMTATWIRANYVVEATFELVTPTETLVTVRTRMQGLSRETDGSEKWIPLQSLGSVEKRVLGKISMKMLGTEPQFKDNKGFWDKKPTPPTPVKKLAAAVH
jgi:hypothetical protein